MCLLKEENELKSCDWTEGACDFVWQINNSKLRGTIYTYEKKFFSLLLRTVY